MAGGWALLKTQLFRLPEKAAARQRGQMGLIMDGEKTARQQEALLRAPA